MASCILFCTIQIHAILYELTVTVYLILMEPKLLWYDYDGWGGYYSFLSQIVVELVREHVGGTNSFSIKIGGKAMMCRDGGGEGTDFWDIRVGDTTVFWDMLLWPQFGETTYRTKACR